jgi:hypothetical protein
VGEGQLCGSPGSLRKRLLDRHLKPKGARVLTARFSIVVVDLGEEGLSRSFSLTAPFLDERQRRLLGASMVEVLGRASQAPVAEASWMSRNTLIAGRRAG